MSNAITTPVYQTLLTDLATILQEGQQDALNKLNEIRLNTYWQMGKRLSKEKELLESEDSGQILTRLAEGLNLELSLLYRILQFYRTWPDGVPAVKGGNTLSWAHFTELLAVKDPKERDYYFEEASRMGWGRNILRKAIKKDLFITSKQPAGKETTNALTRDPNPLFTYKAIVENVVDGDTLEVRIDLGFNVWVSQRIRLRGINTAELVKNGVPAGEAPGRGEQAKAYVQEKLKDIEFIVIKTYKTDMYGRYVADVFYHPTIKNKEDICAAGFFLNQGLLTAGLADVML